MKLNITKQAPDAVQQFFSKELDFSQKVIVKKLGIMEQILGRMEALGIKRKTLAQKMEVSSARITAMLDGTNNFTVETLMRAADALDGELCLTIAPKGQVVKWIHYVEEDIHVSFRPEPKERILAKANFTMKEPVKEDYTDAA